MSRLTKPYFQTTKISNTATVHALQAESSIGALGYNIVSLKHVYMSKTAIVIKEILEFGLLVMRLILCICRGLEM